MIGVRIVESRQFHSSLQMDSSGDEDEDSAPPAFPGMDLDALRGLSLEAADKAVDYVKAQAKSHGFKLSLRDSVGENRIRLICHRANYKNGSKTTKTGCEVWLCLPKRGGGYCNDIPDGLCHNHPLLPPPPDDMPDAVAKSVSDLISLGVSNTQIVQFVEKQTGRLLSTHDIELFRRPEDELVTMSETDRLLASLDIDDQVFVYEATVSGEPRRAGVLVVTEWEMANLQRFGDVVWLDGTSLKNDLGWTTWLIALCDDRKKLTSGGAFFAAFENEEAFVWLLQTVEPLVHDQLKTIFTDEDSALCPAIV
jgi:hypothetical protein